MHRLIKLCAATTVAIGALLFSASSIAAQGNAQDPAVVLHEKAREKFQELHRRMQKLQVSKQATEPEESKLLQSGNRFIQERKINEGMEKSRKLIESADYDEALATMHKVGEDLTCLLEMLLDRDSSVEDLLERIKELEDFRDKVDEILAEQQDEKDAAAETEKLLEHLENIEEAKAAVEKLIDEQTDVRAETNEMGLSAEPAKASKMAEREGELKEAAEELADQLDEVEKEAKDIKAKAGEGQGQPKDGEAKDGEGAGKPGEGEGKGGKGKGCEACESAAQSMQAAGNKLQDMDPENSLKDMDKALDQLEATKDELEKLADEAKRQLEQLPFDMQARKQETTRIDTDKLAQEMEEAEKGDENGPGEPTPGKQNVQQAVPKQKSAAGQLKDYKPAKAKQDQQDAIDDLEQAKQELEDALAQLRQQLEDEVLRALEERFGEMLARQKELSARTKAIDRVQRNNLAAAGKVPANVRATCAELSNGEFELSGEASDALKLIEEDGRSAAFPILVEEVRDDLDKVGGRIGEFKTAEMTQMIQTEIEATLSDLLNALRRTIENREGGT